MDLALVFIGCHRKGGVERSVWEMARYMQSRHEVTVYCRDFDRAGLDDVRHVAIAAPDGVLRVPWFARAAKKALAPASHDHVISFGVGDVGADVLWVNSVHRAWLDLSRATETGLRGSWARRLLPQHQMLLAAERQYFRSSKARLVVVVADQVGKDLRQLYSVPSDRLITVHNGFSPNEFSPDRRRAARKDARQTFGYGDDDVVLLMVANELPRKGFDVLIESIRLADDPRLRLLLVGRAEPSAYRSAIARAGLEQRFSYGGSRSDVGVVHAAADLFVLPTKYEAFCLAIVEALASGLPVVTSGVPGAGDLIADGINGRILQDPDDARSLSDILIQALDGKTRSHWAEAARRSVEKLEWGHLFARAERVLAELPTRDGSVRPRA